MMRIRIPVCITALGTRLSLTTSGCEAEGLLWPRQGGLHSDVLEAGASLASGFPPLLTTLKRCRGGPSPGCHRQ